MDIILFFQYFEIWLLFLYTFVLLINICVMGIRTKIMLGFMILASMLFLSGGILIFELTKLGKSVKGLIYDNYRSIDYSKNMLNALDDQENALLIFALGDSLDYKIKYEMAEQFFMASLDSASKNLTLPDERLYIDSIRLNYSQFQHLANQALESKQFNLGYYLKEVNPSIIITSEHVKNLITINQQGLFNSAAFLEASAQRALMPGLIVIITSLIFTFVFTYLLHHYFVSPVIRLTKGINDYVKFRKPFDVPLESKDELHSLKESIVSLIALIRTSIKKIE